AGTESDMTAGPTSGSGMTAGTAPTGSIGTGATGGGTATGGAQSGGGATTGGGATEPASGGGLGGTGRGPSIAGATSGATGSGVLSATAVDRGPGRPSAGIVRLRDVARVELGDQNYNLACSFDGRPSVGLAIFQLPGSNALDVANRIR